MRCWASPRPEPSRSPSRSGRVPTLGERAVACRHWRWMEGMKTITGHRLDADDADDVDSDGWCPEPPDLDDYATLGCLTALVREASKNPHMFVSRSPRAPLAFDWRVYGIGLDGAVDWSASEGEARGRARTPRKSRVVRARDAHGVVQIPSTVSVAKLTLLGLVSDCPCSLNVRKLDAGRT